MQAKAGSRCCVGDSDMILPAVASAKKGGEVGGGRRSSVMLWLETRKIVSECCFGPLCFKFPVSEGQWARGGGSVPVSQSASIPRSVTGLPSRPPSSPGRRVWPRRAGVAQPGFAPRGPSWTSVVCVPDLLFNDYALGWHFSPSISSPHIKCSADFCCLFKGRV